MHFSDCADLLHRGTVGLSSDLCASMNMHMTFLLIHYASRYTCIVTAYMVISLHSDTCAFAILQPQFHRLPVLMHSSTCTCIHSVVSMHSGMNACMCFCQQLAYICSLTFAMHSLTSKSHSGMSAFNSIHCTLRPQVHNIV